MWRKIVWTKMEMYREQRFREFFSLLQYKLEEELETATIQGKIESQVVYVPLTNVLQAIADATVPYCPGVCLHY
jgi:hypothetical protein